MLEKAQAEYEQVPRSAEEQSAIVEKEKAERFAYARRLERTREAVLFRLDVFESLEMIEFYEGAVQDLIRVESKIKANASTLRDPVICHYCFTCIEQADTHVLNRLYVCPTCATEEGNPLDAEMSELSNNNRTEIPKEIIPERETQPYDLSEWTKDGIEEHHFLQGWDGMYIAKNGEYAPILTRDLMHDCRLNNWWLWFSKKPSEDVRKALHDAGWRWGYGRKQWYHQNQFAQVPDIIIDVYGGYIDGGYCDYRSHRGERLRAYADHVEEKAEHEAEWSEQIVAQYMATGCFVTTYRSTRKLSKMKARAERKAEEARRLDQWAHELRRRANSSEWHQHYMSSTSMLENRIATVEKDRRKKVRLFYEYVEEISTKLHANNPKATREAVIAYYEESYEWKLEIIDEELDLLRLTIEARSNGMPAPEQPIQQEVPQVANREFSIDGVSEIYVGDNRTDVFPTPPNVGALLLNHPGLPRIPKIAQIILEPHGGTGALIDQINLYLEGNAIHAAIHTYELVWKLNQHLQTKKCVVLGEDFLQREDEAIFDAVVMNPPFSNWIDHVEKALAQLKPGGTFLSILPGNWATTRGSRVPAFVHLVEAHGATVPLPYGSFAVSGTNVAVSLVGLVKP